jgi:hypothetical protein
MLSSVIGYLVDVAGGDGGDERKLQESHCDTNCVTNATVKYQLVTGFSHFGAKIDDRDSCFLSI